MAEEDRNSEASLEFKILEEIDSSRYVPHYCTVVNYVINEKICLCSQRNLFMTRDARKEKTFLGKVINPARACTAAAFLILFVMVIVAFATRGGARTVVHFEATRDKTIRDARTTRQYDHSDTYTRFRAK